MLVIDQAQDYCRHTQTRVPDIPLTELEYASPGDVVVRDENIREAVISITITIPLDLFTTTCRLVTKPSPLVLILDNKGRRRVNT